MMTMKKTALIASALLVSALCSGQIVVPPSYNLPFKGRPVKLEQKVWNEGPLTWSDFKTIQNPGDTVASYLYLGWSLMEEVYRQGRECYKYTNVHPTVYKEYSWVDASSMSADELEYNQDLFNLAETIAREYRDSLIFRQKDKKDYNDAFTAKLELARSELRKDDERYRTIGDDGFDITRGWTLKDNSLLWGCALGTSFQTGSMTQIAGPGLLIPCEIGLLFKNQKTAVILQPTVGLSTSNQYWSKMEGNAGGGGRYIRNLEFKAALGQRLFDTEWFSVMAIGGAGWATLGFQNFNLSGPVLSEGVSFDIKMRSWYNFVKKDPSLTRNAISIRATVDQMYNARQSYFMPFINLSIGFRVCDRKIVKK